MSSSPKDDISLKEIIFTQKFDMWYYKYIGTLNMKYNNGDSSYSDEGNGKETAIY